MVPKYRCWFKNSGIQAAHMVEWDKLKEFVGLGRLFDDSKKSTLFTLMQSTGLKDKNGVEIFEGDVYRYKYYLNKKRFKYMYRKVERDEYDIDYFGVFNGFMFPCYYGDVEILGNIYENPELLEGASK